MSCNYQHKHVHAAELGADGIFGDITGFNWVSKYLNNVKHLNTFNAKVSLVFVVNMYMCNAKHNQGIESFVYDRKT